MILTFCGAAGTVTGSKYLLEYGAQKLLIDCGLFQGLKDLRLRNWASPAFSAEDIAAVLLTHAHIDHSGYFPLLSKSGFVGSGYVTPATRELCKVLLPDAGYLQEEEAEYANRKRFSKHHPALPLYTEEDARNCLSQLVAKAWGEKFEPAPGFLASFSQAGHILGAACVKIRANGKVIVFSGDLGRQNDLVMPAPEPIRNTDYLVVESTYGGKIHDATDPLLQLEAVINRTVSRGGTLVIPSFAVGRAQTLLYAIYELKRAKRIPHVPIFLNSPMAISASKIFCDFHADHKVPIHESKDFCEVAEYVHTSAESKALNDKKGPMILIAASGMATGGRVLHHLKAFGPNPKNTILFAGFQAAGTRGAALVGGAKSVKIHGEIIDIEAEVDCLDTLSAHADQQEILAWLSGFANPPKETFITHGEPAQAAALKKAIEEKLGWKCRIPKHEERVEL